MFGIGMPELVIIFVIALLVFGPKELPKIGKTIGKAMGEFRRASDELKEGIQREIDLVEREQADATSSPEASSGTAPAESPVSAAEAAPEPQLELPIAQAPDPSAPPGGVIEPASPPAATEIPPIPSPVAASTDTADSIKNPAPTPSETKHVG